MGALIAALPAVSQTKGGAADEVIDSITGLSVDDLVALALRQNGDILSSRGVVRSVKGGLIQARLRPNPILDVSGMQEYRGPMNSFMIGASIPLELFGRRDRRIEVAERSVAMTESERIDVERRLRAEVSMKFGDALAAAQTLQLTKEQLVINRDALRLTEERGERGAIPTLDASLLRVEVNRLDALRADAEAKVGVAVLELKSLVGMNPDERLQLRGTLTPPDVTEETIEFVLAKRPDIQALRGAEQVAEARVRQAQTAGRLDASLYGSYQRSDSGFPINGFTSQGQLARVQGIFHLATIGVSITLPTRNRNEGAIASAVADQETAKRRREYAELIATREVAASRLQRDKARESLNIYVSGVRDQARQNLAVIRRTYELGRNQLLDVIAEQRRLIDVEAGYIEAMNRYYQATIRLRLALGIE